MNTKMHYVQNWLELARETNWSVSALGKRCGISVRTLERYLLKQMGKSPKAWLTEQRQDQAIELLRKGYTVKETAARLGYKNQHHFSREYKKQNGHPPSQFLVREQFAAKTQGCRV